MEGFEGELLGILVGDKKDGAFLWGKDRETDKEYDYGVGGRKQGDYDLLKWDVYQQEVGIEFEGKIK